MHILAETTLLLVCSNIFMTFAWYAHLRNLHGRSWFIAAVLSWGVAFFEYMFQVPANRIGFTRLTLPQLKVLQEVITLLIFAPFAVFYMGQPMKLDYLWASLCLVGAVYFI
ncbi:MAG: DMT family protein, partial [Candidatus Binatia bacterium]